KGVDISQRSSLGDGLSIDARLSLPESKVAVQAGCGQAVRQSGNRLTKSRAPRRDMRNEIRLMDLRPARDHSSNQRRADAAPDVAHEVQQTGNGVALLRGHSDVRDQGDGDKQKAN